MQQFALGKSAHFTAWINECEMLDFSTDYAMDLRNNIANGAIVEQPLCNGAGR
jgi:hypothetical protein